MANINLTGSFGTKRPGFVQISNAEKAVTFGTYMFKSEFGEVTKMDLGREADEILVTGGWGQLIAFILKNHRYTLNLEILLQGNAPLPGPGDEIEFPLVGVKGRVKGKVGRSADDTNPHKISFEAWSWDSLDNGGAGTAVVTDNPSSSSSSSSSYSSSSSK